MWKKSKKTEQPQPDPYPLKYGGEGTPGQQWTVDAVDHVDRIVEQKITAFENKILWRVVRWVIGTGVVVSIAVLSLILDLFNLVE